MWIFHLCYFKNFFFIKKDQRNFSPSAARPVNGGASNRWGKHCSFSFLNHDYTEEDEEDEKNTLKSSSSSSSV